MKKIIKRFQPLLSVGIFFSWVLIPSLAFCSVQDASSDVSHAVGNEKSGLQWLDWMLIAGYALFMLGIGCYYLHKQKNTEDYLLGGRKVNPIASGISLFASLLSSISYLGIPGETIMHGPVLFSVFLASLVIIYFIVGYVIIPVFMKLHITSAYEILEKPLGVGVRICGSVIFILTRIAWMALLIFLTAKVIVVMMNWDISLIPVITVVVGIITLVYSTMGGLRAVVITDVTQFSLLLLGAVITLLLITIKMGSPMAWFPASWVAEWDSFIILSFDPLVRLSVLGTLIYWVVWWTCTAASDQMAIQRYIATRNVRTARRAFLSSCMAQVTVVTLLMLTGMALLGFFRANPHLLAEGKSITGDADFLFPYYIANMLPVGITGLVVAGVLSAAMSSLSSGINSITTVISSDFIDRFRGVRNIENRRVRAVRYINIIIGVFVVILSSFMDRVPGNIMEVTTKTNGLFVPPLFNLFFMALFVPFATPLGTIIGSIYGFYGGMIVAFLDVITGGPGISFIWIYPVSLLISIVCSMLFSLLPAQGKNAGVHIIWSIVLLLPIVLSFIFLFVV